MRIIISILLAMLSLATVAEEKGDPCTPCSVVNFVKKRIGILMSHDPNEIKGPEGVGEARLVKPGDVMDYTIYFENVSNATAAAQEVRVTLPKDPGLDWSTLELCEVAFGENIDLGLATREESEYRLPGSDCSVKTVVTVTDTAVEWYLRSWDPNTPDNFPANIADGFLPPNDETGRGEGHLRFRVKVKENAAPQSVIRASASIVFDTNDPIETDPAWWNTVGSATAEESLGRYVKLDLVDDLGIEIPEGVDYAAGDKVTVKVEGLAKGLKVVATPVYKDPTATKKVIADYIYTIEGVPAETVDFETRPMYARVTVTYKDKTMGDKGKVETLQPIVLSITTPDPSVLTAGVLNEVYEPTDIEALWPEVADAKVNPMDWSFKGWPAGIKYNNKATAASWSYKDGKATVKTNAEPWTVYGQPTKAGDFTITATHSHKVGKASVKETFTATMRVWADGELTVWNGQAYVATTENLTEAFGAVKSVSGLPTGLKFTAKAMTDKTYGAIAANTVYGKPTKAGTFVVALTLPDPADAKKTVKASFLWKIEPGENPGLGAAAIGWAASKVKYDDGTKKATVLQGHSADFAVDASALAAGAKVTVSGLPSGLKYDARTGKITGVATKAESKVVTVTVVQNGVTVTQRFALDVVANPFAGTYYAYLTQGDVLEAATAVITPAVGGSVKVVLDEYVPSRHKTAKTSVSAKGFTMQKAYDPSDPNAVQIAYDFGLKTDAKNNPDYADGARTLQLVFARSRTDEGFVVSIGELALKSGADITCRGWAQKALNAAECADEVAVLGFAPQQVLTGVFSNGTEQVLYASAVLDEKKLQYKVTGKLADGTAVKALLPITYACFEKTFYSAPCLLTEKGGAQRAYALAFATAASASAAKFWSCETAAVLQPCSAFAADDIPGTAAEQMTADEMKLEAEGLPEFLIVADNPSADRAKAKLSVYAPSAKEGDKPLKTLSPAKLTASAGYVFKCSFMWDAKSGGDGATYSFELVPSNASIATPFVGRCEMKPAKGVPVVVTAGISVIR